MVRFGEEEKKRTKNFNFFFVIKYILILRKIINFQTKTNPLKVTIYTHTHTHKLGHKHTVNERRDIFFSQP